MMRFDISEKQRYFYTFAVIWVIYRFWGYSLFSQLGETVLVHPDVDNTFWIFQILQIPETITRNTAIAAILDISLFLIPLLLLKQFNRGSAILFTILLVIYHITFSMFSCHHFHSLMALILVSIPWWIPKLETRKLTIEAIRYYFLFTMVSAALWKISRGAVFNPFQMTHILESQHAQFLAEFPTSFFATFYKYLIQSQPFSYGLYIAAVVVELAFLVGFFTKKRDRILAFLFITFISFNYLVMGIFSFELLPFLLTLKLNKGEE